MKIVFVIPRLKYSGAPKMMAWIAKQMGERGHNVKFVALFSGKKERKLGKNVEFYWLGVKQSKSRFIRNTFGMLNVLLKLNNYVKEEKPDVLVSFLDSVGYMYLPIARKKCKVVISERVDPRNRRGLLGKIKIWLMKFADLTVFQTDGAREFFRGKYDIYEKSVVIPNPVVITDEIKALRDKIPTFEERDNRIVTVGRLSLKQKRQDILIKAFDIVHKKHPELQLVIYGDGEDRDKIQEIITQMGLNNCVTLAGKVLGVEKEILNAKAFVLTSDYEGIPNALIEALSVGVPCVSTDCSPGGAKLLIDDGENGFLVSCGDAEQIARKTLEIIKSKDISEKFSKIGIVITEEFSETKIADMWEYLFRKQVTCEKIDSENNK